MISAADFLRTVERVAAASEDAVAEEREAIDRVVGPDAVTVSIAEVFRAFDGHPLNRLAHLRNLLDSLDEATLRRLVALMYSGRDGEPYHELLRDRWIAGMDRHEAARTLASKRPLGRYLRRGLERHTSPRREDGADA